MSGSRDFPRGQGWGGGLVKVRASSELPRAVQTRWHGSGRGRLTHARNMSDMQLTEHVSYELRDRIARVTLTRPEARNALSNAVADGPVLAVEGDQKTAGEGACSVSCISD